MTLFKSDLSRNFAIGFVLGALAVGAMNAPDWQAELSTKAYAATASQPVDAGTSR